MGPTRILPDLKMSHGCHGNSAFCPSTCSVCLFVCLNCKELSKAKSLAKILCKPKPLFLALPVLWSGCPSARAISVAAAPQSLVSVWVWLERVTLPAESA